MCVHDTYYIGDSMFTCRLCNDVFDYSPGAPFRLLAKQAIPKVKTPWWDTDEDPRTWNVKVAKSEKKSQKKGSDLSAFF